jgi:hypothetical protein
MHLTTPRRTSQSRPRANSDEPYFIVPPPDSVTVVSGDRRAVLYTADGQPLVRMAGFVPAKETS